MKLLAMTLASLSVLASAPALADPVKLREDLRRVAPALDKYAQERVLGDVWKRPGLSPRDRSIATLAAPMPIGTRPPTPPISVWVGAVPIIISMQNASRPMRAIR